MNSSTSSAPQHQNNSKLTRDQIERVQSSFGRALWDESFLDRFYDILINSNSEIGSKFANTDFVRQKELLRHGLMSVLMFAEGEQSAVACLSRIRDSHGRGKMDVDPGLYPYWIESLIQVVAQCDAKFTDALETDWREVVAPAIEYIQSGH